MKSFANDSLLALAGGYATGTYQVEHSSGVNPLVSQIIVPLIGCFMVPIAKAGALIIIKKLKQKFGK